MMQGGANGVVVEAGRSTWCNGGCKVRELSKSVQRLSGRRACSRHMSSGKQRSQPLFQLELLLCLQHVCSCAAAASTLPAAPSLAMPSTVSSTLKLSICGTPMANSSKCAGLGSASTLHAAVVWSDHLQCHPL